MDTRDGDDNGVFDRLQSFQPIHAQLSRYHDIVVMYASEQQHQQRDYHDYDPGAVQELCGDEDAQDHKCCYCANRIDQERFFPVSGRSDFIGNKVGAMDLLVFQLDVG